MNYQNIAVVFVTSSHKKKTFAHAMDLAKKFNSSITVVNSLFKQPPVLGLFRTKKDKKLEEKQRQEAKESLEEYVRVGKESGIPVKTRIFFSDPASNAIISYVNERKIDLVILDHPKLSSFEENYFGSTICDLHKALKCPLLIIK